MIQPLHGYNPTRVKQKQTSQETGKSSRKFLEPSEKPKVILLTIHWNSANPVKIDHGIIELQHFIDPRQKV